MKNNNNSKNNTHSWTAVSVAAILLAAPAALGQEVSSQYLSDVIRKGEGVIDVTKTISGDALQKYFSSTGGLLLLAADVNEDASGNETRKSMGVAIKQVQLYLQTSAGEFKFSDFFTSTSAELHDAETGKAGAYFTLFGTAGSNDLTSANKEFDLSKYDDVLWLQGIKFDGEIKQATLKISLLDTARKGTASDEFFDFSGGFEDFALLSTADAVLLEKAALGMEAAPRDVMVKSSGTDAVEALAAAGALSEHAAAVDAIDAAEPADLQVADAGESGNDSAGGAGDSAGGGGGASPAPAGGTLPGAPAPPLPVLLGLGALVAAKFRKLRSSHE